MTKSRIILAMEVWAKHGVDPEPLPVRVALEAVGSDRAYTGTRGVLTRFAKPHGFAVVSTSTGQLWLHPESLEEVES